MVRLSTRRKSLAEEVVLAIVAGPFAWCTVTELVERLPGRSAATVRRELARMLAAGELVLWQIPHDSERRVTLSQSTANGPGYGPDREPRYVLVETPQTERPHWWDTTRLDEPRPPRQPLDMHGSLFPSWLDRLDDLDARGLADRLGVTPYRVMTWAFQRAIPYHRDRRGRLKFRIEKVLPKVEVILEREELERLAIEARKLEELAEKKARRLARELKRNPPPPPPLVLWGRVPEPFKPKPQRGASGRSAHSPGRQPMMAAM